MKKFTSLMLMLLCAVTTWGQVFTNNNLKELTPGYYYIYYTDANSVKHYIQTNGSNSFSTVTENPNYYSISVGDGSQFSKAYHIEMNGYCFSNPNPNNNHSLNTGRHNYDNEVYISTVVFENSDGLCAMRSTNAAVTSWDENYFITHDESNNIVAIDGNTGGESLFVWTIEEVTFYDITYEFTYDGNTIGSETVEAMGGTTFPTPRYPFGFTGSTVSGNVSESGTHTIECTPIEGMVADSYENITTWYYINVRDDDPTYMYYDSNKENIPATSSTPAPNSTAEEKDAYSWAFVGNIADGSISIVNKAAGATMVLSSPADPTGNQNADQLARMVDAATATGNTTWTFVTSTHSGAAVGGFYIQHPTATSYAFNRQDYKQNDVTTKTVCYWNQRDTGSIFQLVERPSLNNELAALIEQYEALNITSGENPGEYTADGVTAFEAALATAKEVSVAEQEHIDNLIAAYNAIPTNPVVAGKYMIVSANANKATATAISCYGYTETWGAVSYSPAWAELDENSPWQYWTLEENGDGFSIKATYEGKYITSSNSFTETATAATFTALGIGNGQFNIFLGESTTPLHANGWNWSGETSGGIIEYTAGANTASAWKLVKVTEEPTLKHTLAMSEAGWATLTVGFNTVIPAGVKCYAVSELNSTHAVLTEVSDILPANTPVLVQRDEDNSETSFAFNYTTESGNAVEGNKLAGSHFRSKVTPADNTTYYILAMVEGEVGLYPDRLADEYFRNNANKAYLPVTSENAATGYSFVFDWAGTTGIEGVAAEGAQNGKIYDITGREVKAMTVPGLYIINGKKVVK